MTDRAPVIHPRDTLLLSHANPEDNEFTLWLALQLAIEGYRLWCDLTKLLGRNDRRHDEALISAFEIPRECFEDERHRPARTLAARILGYGEIPTYYSTAPF